MTGTKTGSMTDPLYLAIDLGTSSVRAALVDGHGRITAFASRFYQQVIPQFGWAEQSATAWWEGALGAIREVVAGADATRIAAICTCGQMHGTVLIDADGRLARDAVLLWNDKRAAADVAAWSASHPFADYAATTANPATPAWPAFKLRWLRDYDPLAYARTATVLTPKDFINFQLTGIRATDWTEASASFLADHRTRSWSRPLIEALGLRHDFLPDIHDPGTVLGPITAAIAQATGLREGTPVLAGGGDLPIALLGSGAFVAGAFSDITGTSAIATSIGPAPILGPLVSNVAVPGGNWGAFTLVDAGGDAVRWTRRVLIEDGEPATAAPGSNGLFFLPFLSGQRLGQSQNARAQFFGLTASHGPAELKRAVLEGVTMALKQQFDTIGMRPERFITAGAAGRSELWLKIKAAIYGVPLLVPRELECGAIGCAILAAAATTGGTLSEHAAGMAGIDHEVLPDPAWQERYARMLPLFGHLREAMAPLNDELDALMR